MRSRARVGIRETRSWDAGLSRHEAFAGNDAEKEEQERRRELLAQALAGNRRALAELRALRLTRWERDGLVLIENGELVGVKRTEGGGDEDSAG